MSHTKGNEFPMNSLYCIINRFFARFIDEMIAQSNSRACFRQFILNERHGGCVRSEGQWFLKTDMKTECKPLKEWSIFDIHFNIYAV